MHVPLFGQRVKKAENLVANNSNIAGEDNVLQFPIMARAVIGAEVALAA